MLRLDSIEFHLDIMLHVCCLAVNFCSTGKGEGAGREYKFKLIVMKWLATPSATANNKARFAYDAIIQLRKH